MTAAADPLGAARDALDRADREPRAALAAAVSVLSDDAVAPEVGATAHWAAGLAGRELGEFLEADEHLVAAARIADGAGLTDIAGGSRTSRALVLAYLGRPDEALVEVDLAIGLLAGRLLARAHIQRGLILQRLGRLDEAIDSFAAARPSLDLADDPVTRLRMLTNRGVALTYRNRLAEADHDLRAAREAAAELGMSMQVAMCSHNLGFLHGRRGDIPESLDWFDRASIELRVAGAGADHVAVTLADRAEVLLDAGLEAEAAEAATHATTLLAGSTNVVQVAEARLMLARTALAVGDRRLANREAVAAFDAFNGQQRTSWATLARYLMLTAGRPDRPDALTADDIEALADDLAESGWSLEAATTRIIAGSRALDAGDMAAAGRLLTDAARARKGGSAVYRSGGWYAQALRLVAAGERPKARRAVRTGLRILEDHRSTLGAADLRAHAAAHGERLAALLVSMAIQDGRAGGILAAAESWRAGGVAVAARPPEHPGLAERLSALRARAALRRAGEVPEPDLETARLESEIRDLVRVLPGASRAGTRNGGAHLDAADQPAAPAFDRKAVGARLGDRMLVEWVVQGDQLLVVWVVGGRSSWARLGPVAPIASTIDTVRMCLHRLAWGGGSVRSLAATAGALGTAAAQLESALFGAIRDVAARELVLVPTGTLHRLPWAALPSVRAAPFVVAPSARSWLNADLLTRRPVSLLAAAGPDLPGAAAEVADIAALFSSGRVLDAEHATVGAVLEALGEVSVAHLATHGTFRADNPQFSSLALADGDLTVYDLQQLARVPETIVIAACDTATSAIRPGDELLGLSAALLSLGARSVIAPSVPVSDTATSEVMVELQRSLLAGERAPVALHRAMVAASAGDRAAAAVAQSFVTLGA